MVGGPVPDLWLAGDHFIGKLFAVCLPAITNAAFHPSGVELGADELVVGGGVGWFYDRRRRRRRRQTG